MFEGAAGPGWLSGGWLGLASPEKGFPTAQETCHSYIRVPTTGELLGLERAGWSQLGTRVGTQLGYLAFIALSSCPGTAPGILLIDGYCLLFQSLRISFSSDHNSRQYSVIFSTFVFCPLQQIALPWLEVNSHLLLWVPLFIRQSESSSDTSLFAKRDLCL